MMMTLKVTNVVLQTHFMVSSYEIIQSHLCTHLDPRIGLKLHSKRSQKRKGGEPTGE